MKFGKRRWEAKYAEKAGAAAPAYKPPGSPAPIAESWAVPAAREPDLSPEVQDEGEAAVDGEAVELPLTDVAAGEAPADSGATRVSDIPAQATRVTPIPPPRPPGEPLPPPGASWNPPARPVAPPMPYPVAEEPVLVYTSGSESPAVTPLAETAEAHASGHAYGTSPSWPEPVMQIAAERPEVLVGAAFAGGLVLAMILRRLGH